MCGIVGITGNRPVVDRLVSALKRLEYRGYDSAGVAVVEGNDAGDSHLSVQKSAGRVSTLEARLQHTPMDGTLGIGHTRWGTHGQANHTNAHPHATADVAIVHNGIIENYQELKTQLLAKGVIFQSETDSEVIVHLLQDALNQGATPVEATARTLPLLKGSFALAILFRKFPDLLIGARHGSPLVVGHGDGEMFLGSDALALLGLSHRITYLDDDDWVVLTPTSATFYRRSGETVERPIVDVVVCDDEVSLQGYPHFMLKEIHEQPQTLAATLTALLPEGSLTGHAPSPTWVHYLTSFQPRWDAGAPLTLVACGTSFYAAQLARFWIEQWANIPVNVEVASEFRYRQSPLHPAGIALFISQSGETADTLAALELARQRGQTCWSLVNVEESSLARASDMVFVTRAGREIGVASTKAFTAQLMALACLALALGHTRGRFTTTDIEKCYQDLSTLPRLAHEVLSSPDQLRPMVDTLVKARSVLFIGRGLMHPMVMEGALKLKELSYVHAEGFPAGEMKHGPIALIDADVPVVVLAPSHNKLLFEKTLSNAHEAKVRGAPILLLTDDAGRQNAESVSDVLTILPASSDVTAPFIMAFVLQLMAYQTAVRLGHDVDRPRNLAKSVTVE